MLRIVLKDGSVREFNENQYTDYDWKKEAFIVMHENQWIAIFNWECVREVLYLNE